MPTQGSEMKWIRERSTFKATARQLIQKLLGIAARCSNSCNLINNKEECKAMIGKLKREKKMQKNAETIWEQFYVSCFVKKHSGKLGYKFS